MVFKDFRFQIILRLAGLTLLGYGLLYYAFIEHNAIRIFFLALFSLLLLINLFYYLYRTHRITSNFLEAILNNDFTIKYPTVHESKQLSDLYEKFNKVNDKFSQNLQDQANQYQYLMTMINQLKIAVVAFDERERVHVVNSAFKALVEQKEVIKLSSVKAISNTLYESILELKPNEQKVVRVTIQGQIHRFSVAASIFKLRQREYTLVSLQDIHAELDQNEMEAWQKLIRVLTHEIMNSVSPIASLSSSLENLLLKSTQTSEHKSTLLEGMGAIKARSQGLMNFTQAYRKLTRIPIPRIETIEATPFIQQIETLFRSTLPADTIRFQVEVHENCPKLLLDPDLMQQVIINLLKNALEAVPAQTGSIQLALKPHEATGQVEITVADNGPGIDEKIAEQIFIPFFTTKSEGSGIGLSLARQIVQLHGGSLSFQTGSNGTTFSIKL